jgi:hypothetical protein
MDFGKKEMSSFYTKGDIFLRFTPHPVKPRSSPASLPEAGRAERKYRGASKYLPQRKPRVLIQGAGFTDSGFGVLHRRFAYLGKYHL